MEVKDTTTSTTTIIPNRALFQSQFMVIADTLFTTEPPEDSHYPARRIPEHEVAKSGLPYYQFIELPLKASGWHGNQAFLVPMVHCIHYKRKIANIVTNNHIV